MQIKRWKGFSKFILRIGLSIVILFAIIFFVGKNWSQQWHDLMTHRFQVNFWLLALAFLGFVLQELSYGLIWRRILVRLGFELDLRPCLRIYLASEFVRYIPGNIWHILTRILWIGKYGVPRPVAFASITIELITKLAAGALIFAVSLLFWSNISAISSLAQGTPLLVIFGIVNMLALLIGLHPRVLNSLLMVGLRLLKRDPVELSLRYRTILLITLAWCGSWIIAGCAFFVLLLSLWPDTPFALLPICIGIYAIAWDIGFISFITPSGLGFREAAITTIFVLAFPLLPTGMSAIIAILSRLVSTVAELLCVSIAYMSGGQYVRIIEREELALLAKAEVPAGREEIIERASEHSV
jgi:glycosyltransferase 2 family protein